MAVQIPKEIPVLTGKKAKEFVREAQEVKSVKISTDQREMYEYMMAQAKKALTFR